jgi:multidrug/hemolysin transport system permease protein
MTGLMIRNLKVFFRDKTSVFFSLLAVFIIIALYVLFLGDVWVNNFQDMNGVRYMMNTWIMAGLLAVTSVTTTMGAFGTMIDDKVKKITKDFTSSPLKRGQLAGAYIASSFIIGVVMCVITLILAVIFIVASGGEMLSLSETIKVLGLILLSTLTNTSIVLFIVSFFKSLNAFATASTIIGTMIGFLTGIYLPIGQLPQAVQFVVKVFPVSHAAVLFRQVMMAYPISYAFAGAPPETVEGFKDMMGVTLKFGESIVTPLISIIILVLTALLFFALSILNLSKKKK